MFPIVLGVLGLGMVVAAVILASSGAEPASTTAEATGTAVTDAPPGRVEKGSAATAAPVATIRIDRGPFSYEPLPEGCPPWFPSVTLEFGGAVVDGTILGGYSCGSLFADTFFYGFESKSPLVPIPEGTDVRIEGLDDLKGLTLVPVEQSGGRRLVTKGDSTTLAGVGGYTFEVDVAWDRSSLTFGLPVRIVDASSPVPLASISLADSGSRTTLSFGGREIYASAATAELSRGEVRVSPVTTITDRLQLSPSVEIWVNADPGDVSAAWVIEEGDTSDIRRVDLGYYDSMGLDLSGLESGLYQLLIGAREGKKPVGYAFGIEVLDGG